MKTKLLLLFSAAVLFSFETTIELRRAASSPVEPATETTYILHVTVVDTETGKLDPDRTVVISGHRIAEIEPSRNTKLPGGVRVVDGKGKFLIPGLWDMHEHAVRLARIPSMLPLLVANGVVGIRDMGSDMPGAEIERLRAEIASGARLGPRVVATGQILDGRPVAASPTFLVILKPDQGREAVRALGAGGARFIKVYSWLSRESYFAIAEQAKSLGLPLTGHVPLSVTVLEASDAGQKSIEHLTGVDLACSDRESELREKLLGLGTEMTNQTRWSIEAVQALDSYNEQKATQLFAHLARNHTWQVPTFVAFLQDAELNDRRVTNDPRLEYIPPSVRKKWSEYAEQHAGPSGWDRAFEKRLAMVGAMHRAGVPILAGSDAGWGVPYVYAGFSLHDELALLVRAGLTPIEALRSATLGPARYLGMEKELGTVSKGKQADLLLLTANPLEEIRNTQKIDAVFLAGRLIDRIELDLLLAEARSAVKDQ